MRRLGTAFDTLVVALAALFLLAGLIAVVRQPQRSREVALQVPAQTEAAPTVTPYPTREPSRTYTLEPTDTSVPIKATETLKLTPPRATSTPPATATEISTLPRPTTGDGLGVARTTVQSMFESKDEGFQFEPAFSANGQPRAIGRAEKSPILIELIGPPDNLVSVSITVPMPDAAADAAAKGVEYMLALLEVVAPDWEQGSDWLFANLLTVAEMGEVRTTHENLRIVLQHIEGFEMNFLTIEAQ
ncbi:MAG: hypothetical protein ACE5LU_10725 [Anaerolineae bacterium]